MADYDAGSVANIDVGESPGSFGITGKSSGAGVCSASYYLTEIFGEEPLDPVFDIGQVTDLLKTGGAPPVGSYRTIPRLVRSTP
jgi:hypothetical protein